MDDRPAGVLVRNEDLEGRREHGRIPTLAQGQKDAVGEGVQVPEEKVKQELVQMGDPSRNLGHNSGPDGSQYKPAAVPAQELPEFFKRPIYAPSLQ